MATTKTKNKIGQTTHIKRLEVKPEFQQAVTDKAVGYLHRIELTKKNKTTQKLFTSKHKHDTMSLIGQVKQKLTRWPKRKANEMEKLSKLSIDVQRFLAAVTTVSAIMYVAKIYFSDDPLALVMSAVIGLVVVNILSKPIK